MGRQATEPRYRPARDTWYVQIDGRQVTLAKGKANKKAAWDEFRRLMAEKNRPVGEAAPVPLVVDVIAKYLAEMARRRDAGEIAPQTKDDADRRLAGFAEFSLPDGRRIGDLPVDRLKEHHVTAWIDSRRYVPPHRSAARAPKRSRPGRPKATDPKPEPVPPAPPAPRPLGPTARHDAVGAVKAAFRWAKSAGHLEHDPADRFKKPARNPRREAVIDAGQWPAVFAAIRSERFRDLAEFLYETGARPGEAYRVEARHIDLADGVMVLNPREHKTGKKTRKARAVYLTGRALEILKRLCEQYPAGPIFRSEAGVRWNKDSVNSQVRRVRERAGVGNEFVAYALRHLFATEALDKGVGLETLARLMGHSDTRMISQVYSHLDERHEHFRAAVEKIRGDGSGGNTPDP